MPEPKRPEEHPDHPSHAAGAASAPARPGTARPGGFDVGAAAAAVRAALGDEASAAERTHAWDLGQASAAGDAAELEPRLPAEPAELEPLLPTAQARPAPNPADVTVRVAGVHRVVVHTEDGLVRRGTVTDAVLGAGALLLSGPAGGPQPLDAERVRAVFFMLPAGRPPPPPAGRAVRVTFTDGRELAGTVPDDDGARPGFFLVPRDPRTRAERVWIRRSAVRSVVDG